MGNCSWICIRTDELLSPSHSDRKVFSFDKFDSPSKNPFSIEQNKDHRFKDQLGEETPTFGQKIQIIPFKVSHESEELSPPKAASRVSPLAVEGSFGILEKPIMKEENLRLKISNSPKLIN